VSPSHKIIVKAERKPPKIGEKVVDEKLRTVGTVFDVFGPVSSPYISVKPLLKTPETLVNKPLYVVPSVRRER